MATTKIQNCPPPAPRLCTKHTHTGCILSAYETHQYVQLSMYLVTEHRYEYITTKPFVSLCKWIVTEKTASSHFEYICSGCAYQLAFDSGRSLPTKYDFDTNRIQDCKWGELNWQRFNKMGNTIANNTFSTLTVTEMKTLQNRVSN